MGTSDEFWDRVHERWRAEDPGTERAAVRAILTHLRRRLRAPEVRHLEDELPREVREYWAEPALEDFRRGQRPLEKTDFEEFLSLVADEAGLDGRAEAERATAAVLHALTPLIGDTEEKHLTDQLPEGLKKLWRKEMGIAEHPYRPPRYRTDHAPRRVWGGGPPKRWKRKD